MLIKKIVVWFVFISFLFSCKDGKIQQIKTQIIPVPSNQEIIKGSFELNNTSGLSFDSEFKVSAAFLKAFIEDGSSITLKENNVISFIKDSTINHSEGYKLEVTPKSIEIRAKTDHGAFYAVQSVRQLLPTEFENGTFSDKKVLIPCITIKDEPQFTYRGMHLDVGRHLFSVDFIKKYIDALAMLKMNTFHWHLTEDQGWRIEIKKYPKLQEIAAYRNETLIGHYNTQPQLFDSKKYGGYYTQEEIKDVVAYAQERFVTIIPEIELPGHSQAAIAAYPELGCTGEQVDVATKWGVFDDIYCSKDASFDFLENVLDEVLELFPSTYIHIGGDEAPKTRWKTCNDCQNRIASEGLKGEHELQNYFITRIEQYLNSKGRQIIGWDEILEGGLAPNASVMSWRGTNGAIEAAKKGHQVIMTPTSHCYFDYYQSDNENEPIAIGGYLPLEKVYEFNPIPEGLTSDESKFILGAQGNLWTEYMSTEAQVEYMAFPRMIAMSEVVWSSSESKNYPDFISRLEQFHKRLDTLQINYANHLYEVEGELKSEGYQLKTLTKDKTIRYTLDSSEPKLHSELYEKPIPIDKSTTIKAAVFNSGKQLGSTFVQSINYHKAIDQNISINIEPNAAYSGSGASGLINGISGSNSRYGDKEWLGFWGEDLVITLNFESETSINEIKTRFHNGNGQWIYAPKTILVKFDNGEFSEYDLNASDELIKNWTMNFNSIAAKQITLSIPNFGKIPEGNQGSGHKAWTFIDEIIIN
ncbi:beta-N-acetylhexosaminidase [Flavobacteriales bacterium 34_180_T64]|nr:beta-N-acetylhexosaminidase [Flavobacteriales bacterium 34_180_T64]